MDVIAIPRSGKAEHVLQNMEAGKVHLTAEEYARLDAAFPAPRKKHILILCKSKWNVDGEIQIKKIEKDHIYR